MKRINIFIILTAILVFFASCERRHKYDVIMLYPNWADGIAITHLANVILKDKGYNVSLKRLEPGPIFTSLSRGDTDIYMDAWLPYTHKDYWDKYGDRLDIIGTVFDDGSTGLVVPSYVDVNSIEELNANKDKFGGKIYGIASGAGIFVNTTKAIDKYDLNYTQVASSETSMIAALKKSMSSKEPIIITGWKPHFIWSSFDIKMLDDPRHAYPVDSIQTVSRKGFAQDKPELGVFFKNFKLSEAMLNELMEEVTKDKDPDVGAARFYNKYKDELGSWLVEKKVTN